MGVLEDFETKLGLPSGRWTKKHWQEVALALAHTIDGKPTRKVGRPPSATSVASATANYQALAWQVKQQIESAKEQGRKIKIADAVREQMQASVERRNKNGRPTRASIVRVKFPTAYTEVRKILSKWKKAEK